MLRIKFTPQKCPFGTKAGITIASIMDENSNQVAFYMLKRNAEGKAAFVAWLEEFYPALAISYKVAGRKTKAEKKRALNDLLFGVDSPMYRHGTQKGMQELREKELYDNCEIEWASIKCIRPLTNHDWSNDARGLMDEIRKYAEERDYVSRQYRADPSRILASRLPK